MIGCKKSVEKLFERMDATELTFNEQQSERKDLKNEIHNLKKLNDARVKERREEVSGCKNSLQNLLEN